MRAEGRRQQMARHREALARSRPQSAMARVPGGPRGATPVAASPLPASAYRVRRSPLPPAHAAGGAVAFDPRTKETVETVFPAALPKGRFTAAALREWVAANRTAAPARPEGTDAAQLRAAQRANAVAFQEAARQVRLSCEELGDVLEMVWDDFVGLFGAVLGRLHPLRDQLLRAEVRDREARQREARLRAALEERELGLQATRRELTAYVSKNDALQDAYERIQMDMLQRKRRAAVDAAKLAKLLEVERARVEQLLTEKGDETDLQREQREAEAKRNREMAAELAMLRKKHLVQVRELEMLRAAKLGPEGTLWKQQMERLERELGTVLHERTKLTEERDFALRRAEEQQRQVGIMERVNGDIVAELEDAREVIALLEERGYDVKTIVNLPPNSSVTSPKYGSPGGAGSGSARGIGGRKLGGGKRQLSAKLRRAMTSKALSPPPGGAGGEGGEGAETGSSGGSGGEGGDAAKPAAAPLTPGALKLRRKLGLNLEAVGPQTGGDKSAPGSPRSVGSPRTPGGKRARRTPRRSPAASSSTSSSPRLTRQDSR